jgi:hypothetical protein
MKPGVRFALLPLLALSAISPAAADDVPPSPDPGDRTAAAEITPDEVPLGGLLRYTLTVRHRPGDRVQLPPREADPFAPFRVRGEPTRSEQTGGSTTTLTFELLALDPEAREVPAFPLSIIDAAGGTFDVRADPVAVRIVDPAANEPLDGLEARGAKGADGRVDRVRPYSIQLRDWTLAWIAAIAAGVLLVALLAVLITRWVLRRRRAGEPAGPPPVPPYPTVRRRLARLRLPNAYADLGAEPFHVELAEALREYLGRRQGIDALEMTSTELLEAIRGRPMGNVTPIEVEMFLASCDVVKFARGEPPELQALDALGQGERIVEEVEVAVAAEERRRAAETAAREAAEAAAREAAERAAGGPAGATGAKAAEEEAADSRFQAATPPADGGPAASARPPAAPPVVDDLAHPEDVRRPGGGGGGP